METSVWLSSLPEGATLSDISLRFSFPLQVDRLALPMPRAVTGSFDWLCGSACEVALFAVIIGGWSVGKDVGLLAEATV